MTMRRLILVACLLTLVVAAEAAYWFVADSPTDRTAAAVRRADAPVAGGTARAEGSADRWTAVVLARPLFAPDRKPVPGTMAAQPGMPRLTGIIATPEGALAIFQPAGTIRPVVARLGERIGGWEVMGITVDAVNLHKENDVIALAPQFDGEVRNGDAIKVAKKPSTRWEAPPATGMLRARWSNPQLQP